MVKILGLPFDDYVNKQFETRQAKLSTTQKSPEEISAFNSNTAWIRLSSGVKIEPARAKEISTKLSISETLVQGTALARNLVLWGGVSSFTPTDGKAVLDPIKGGIGYSLDNTYGFLSGPEQGLKPPPGITSITCNYKNNGSLKQATVNMKCYTRSQFEALEAVYLRLGYTVVLEWGNTLWFDNAGEYQQTRAYSIPNILFKDQNDVDPDLIYQRLAYNKRATSCNYDGMLGKVTNYSWTLSDDLSFNIKLDLISTGDIIDSLKVNIGGTNTENLKSQIQVSQSFQNLVAIQVNKEASKLNGFFYELYDEVFKPLLSNYGSLENQEAVDKIDKAVEAVDDLQVIRNKYKQVTDELRTYYTAFNQGLAIYNRSTYRLVTNSGGAIEPVRSIQPADAAEWKQVADKFNVQPSFLFTLYEDTEGEIEGATNYVKALDQIDSWFTGLKSGTDDVALGNINYFKKSKIQKEDVIFILSNGYTPPGTTNVKIEGSRYEDGNTFTDKVFSNVLERLLEGLNVG